jgi:hypothetical protein
MSESPIDIRPGAAGAGQSGPFPALAAGGVGGLLLASLALGVGLGWFAAFLAYSLGGSAAMLALAAAADRPRSSLRRVAALSGRLRLQRAFHG